MPPKSYLDAKEKRPLTPEESKVLIMLTAAKDEIVPATQLDEAIGRIFGDELRGSFHVQVMVKRLAAMRPDLSFSPIMLVLLAMLSDRVGVAVCWSYTMMDFNRRKGMPMTLTAFCDSDEFGMGIPTEDEMRRLWDEQKLSREDSERLRTDNQIDTREAWAERHTTVS